MTLDEFKQAWQDLTTEDRKAFRKWLAEQDAEVAVKAERRRNSGIASLCHGRGQMSRAVGFINSGLSVADVRRVLNGEPVTAKAPDNLIARICPATRAALFND